MILMPMGDQQQVGLQLGGIDRRGDLAHQTPLGFGPIGEIRVDHHDRSGRSFQEIPCLSEPNDRDRSFLDLEIVDLFFQ